MVLKILNFSGSILINKNSIHGEIKKKHLKQETHAIIQFKH